MMILHVDSSILGAYSVSRSPSAAIVARQQALHPSSKVKALFVGAGINPLDKSFTVGFEATGTIKRGDFGIKEYLPLVGDDVALRVARVFVLKS